MDAGILPQLKDLGLAASIGLAGVGSAIGCGIAGAAAIGAWKKCLAQNKAAPFLLLAFAGAPMTQTIYGMILMNVIAAAAANGQFFWGVGIFGGAAIGASAIYQGVAAAGGADALAETGKGFANYLLVVGIIETIAIIVMIFLSGMVKSMGA